MSLPEGEAGNQRYFTVRVSRDDVQLSDPVESGHEPIGTVVEILSFT